MIKLITHDDLDGVGCAILGKLFFKDISITFINNPKEANQYLAKIDPAEYKSIFITDCSCDEEYFYLINNLYLFDHHKTAEKLNRLDGAIVNITLNNRPTCGTELFHNFLVNQGLKPVPYFVELIRQYDTWEWKKQLSKLPAYLNNLLCFIGKQKFVETYTQRLQNGDISELNIFSEKERLLLTNYEAQINTTVQNHLDTMRIIETDKYRIGISFADYPISEIGSQAASQLNCDLVVMLDLNSNIIHLRTANDNIDVSKLALKFNGGGHKQAAGGHLNKNDTQEFITKILSKLGDDIGTTK